MNVLKKLIGKCDKCGRGFAMKKTRDSIVMREDIKILESLTEPNPKGGVDRKIERFVPGERIYYCVEHKCKFCGSETVEYTTKEVKK